MPFELQRAQCTPITTPSPADSGLATVLEQILSELVDIRDRIAGTQKPLLTIDEIARLTGRTPYTVRRWVKDGRLVATRVAGTGPKGRLLIDRCQLSNLIAHGQGAAIPAINAGV